MKAIKLDDLIPEKATVFLKTVNKGFILRPISLDDQMWIKRKWNDDELKKLLETVDMGELSKLVYRLIEDKTEFKAQDITEIDEEGEEKKTRVSGPELLRKSIFGDAEKIVVYKALMQTIGISAPMFDEMAGDEIKKNNEIVIPVGGEYSMPSQASTDTPMNKSKK